MYTLNTLKSSISPNMAWTLLVQKERYKKEDGGIFPSVPGGRWLAMN